MRITQQNIVQNNINISKSQITPNEAKALIGNIIEGRITAIQGQQLATLTTGDKQLNININGLNLQENQLVNLKITGYKDGALIAKLVGGAPSSDSNHSLNEMLSKLGISEHAENVTILEAMKTANIPITKDNFQMMRQGMSEVKALISELASTGQLPLENSLETPIKALALKIIQQNIGTNVEGKNAQTGVLTTNTSTQTSGNNMSTTVSSAQSALGESLLDVESGARIDLSKVMDRPVNATSIANTANSANAANAANAALVSDSINATNTNNGVTSDATEFESITKAIQLVFDKDGSSLKESIKALLGQFDYKQESLIIKNELPITLKNIFLAYDALSEEGGITNRFSEVFKGLETVPFSKEAILNIVTALTSEVTQEEKLETLLEAVRKELPDSEIRQGLERELSVIKDSTIMNKALNDQMMFMQMPIPINDQIQNVDIYYKKNKKKPDPDDLTLLIALKTYNFGEVRCVVHKQVRTFTLNFSFIDEATMSHFETKKEQLLTALATHKDKQFALTFSVKSNLPEFEINERSDFESFGFDLKV